jgi:iron complex outermembrane receptor protein
VAQTASPTLEEVVVTAQRKTESLQEAPIAITALGANELESQGISDLTDLRGTTPSLSVAPFAGDRATPVVFVRGMGTIVVQTTQDTAVGLYVDGVALGRATGLAADIADIERIEVLRGPQGTLYGKNATAGAINYITKKPGEKFAFEQALTFGNYNKYVSKTSVDLPINDQLLTKLTYLNAEEDGWVDNNAALPNQIDYNEQQNRAGHFALRYLPTDALTVDYSYDKSDMEYGNSFYQVTGGELVDREDKTAQGFGLNPSDTQIEGHSLTFTLEGENVTFKSITSYRELDAEIFQNYIGAFYQHTFVDQEQYSQEFQLIGTLSDRFDYVVGLFYYKEESEEWASSSFGFAPSDDIWQVNGEAESRAIFGQGTWTPDVLEDRLSITLGLRYTDDDRSADKTFLSNLFTGPDPAPLFLKGDISNEQINPMLTFDFAIDDNINSYFKVATGYRSGGFNTRSTKEGFAAGFDEENVLSYELGLKSQLFDNRVRINGAIYYNDYDDLQVSQVRPGIVFTDILNAGKATTKGAEVEITAYLTDRLSTQMFYAYIDAKFDEYLDNGVDLSDINTVPYAPRNAGKLAFNYDLAYTRHGNYSIQFDYQHQTKTYSGPRPADFNRSYDLFNARLQLDEITFGDSKMRVGVWGKNITDKEYTTLTTNFGSPGTTSSVASVYGMPRTYGIDVVFDY